jgi:hypothetical protein
MSRIRFQIFPRTWWKRQKSWRRVRSLFIGSRLYYWSCTKIRDS